MGGIESDFKFNAYKIDLVNLRMAKKLELLHFQGTFKPEMFELNVAIRQPLFFKKHNNYVGGLDVGFKIVNKSSENKPIPFLTVQIGISGSFSVERGRLTEDIEYILVRNQIPTILMPYVRASLMSLLSSSGFGSIVIPLINIHKVVEETPSLEVQEVE